MANDTKKKSAKVRLEDAFTPKASISKKAYALLAVLSRPFQVLCKRLKLI